MNMINKVRIEIGGSTYMISTAEPEEYVTKLAFEVDEQIRDMQEKNQNLSINEALVLCALSYIDSYKKSEQSCDNMRSQVTEYLEDAARTRIELDEARREVDRLSRELTSLKKG